LPDTTDDFRDEAADKHKSRDGQQIDDDQTSQFHKTQVCHDPM
jgi:hypothetical protein